MRWSDVGSETCSVARALGVIGDRWTLLILREAFQRTRRFEDFQAHTGAARHIVADRLKKLVGHGVLERRKYQEKPARHEYRLTQKGLDLHPIIMAIVAWGDRWMDEGEGPPLELVHKGCGQPMTSVAVCSECGEPLDPRSVQPQPGPALQKLLEADPESLRRFEKRDLK
jgi:DNA-binding HxlR family transcriptional regulator